GETSVKLSNLTANIPQPVSLRIPGIDKQPAIITLTFTLPGKAPRSTEFLYSANPALYFAPETASPYRARIPKKVKPELLEGRDLHLQPHQGLSIFYGAGIWHELNRLPEIFTAIDPQATVKTSYFASGVLGPELTVQPQLAEDLLGYDLVVLNNVGANALGEAGEIAVDQYVQAGGSLLICGGLYTLGRGRFNESPLAAALPIVPGGFFDIEKMPKFRPISDAKLGAVQWIQRPQSVKPGAQVLLTVDGKPLLVTGRYGKGQVAVWLGTPMGTPPKNLAPYWESPTWFAYMKELVRTLTTGK
ncbi:MAG TPA: hypothetical protein VGM23_01820, partial [Armatimonadota bacterium]